MKTLIVGIFSIAAAAACSSESSDSGAGGTAQTTDATVNTGGTAAGGGAAGGSHGGATGGTAGGSGGAAGGSGGATGGSGGANSGFGGADWVNLNPMQKKDYMVQVVMPRMIELYTEFDPAEAANFTCASCHGANAADVQFRMPNGISPIDPANFPTPNSPDPEIARQAAFMTNTLTPEMTRLIGAQPFDRMTMMGFGCFSCHGRQ